MTASPTATDALATKPLTEQTDCGGCAAKLGADLLAEALGGLGAQATPDALLVGLDAPDDAAVYRLADDLAVVATLDFFPPLVDDPATFGAIAAANAMSDVYAMGARVLFALGIAAFPEALPRETMSAIFAGAATTVREMAAGSSPAATRSRTRNRSTGWRSSASSTRTGSCARAARGPATRSS